MKDWLEARDNISHLKIEDGKGRPLGRSFQVRLWPTLVVLHDGQEVARVVRPRADADLAALVAAIIQGQNENQLAIAAASTANLMAFHTTTAQALATRSGDKLTNIKRKILQACSGEGDTPEFSPTVVYSESKRREARRKP